MTEAELQALVLDAARLLGWRVAHFRPARTSHGWRTPVAGDGAGFPDLVMLRSPRLVIAELKAERGRLTDAQHAWLDAWRNVPAAEVHIVRPANLDTFINHIARARTEHP